MDYLVTAGRTDGLSTDYTKILHLGLATHQVTSRESIALVGCRAV